MFALIAPPYIKIQPVQNAAQNSKNLFQKRQVWNLKIPHTFTFSPNRLNHDSPNRKQ